MVRQRAGTTDEARPEALVGTPPPPVTLPPERTQAASRPRDHWTFVMLLAVQAALLCLGKLTPHERRLLWVFVASTLAVVAAKLLAPRLYSGALRTPALAALRTAIVLVPLAFDTQRILQPAGAADGGSGTSAAQLSLGGMLRSLFVLLLPLAWVDGLVVTAVGFPLPPLVHLAAQSLGVGLLMQRAPAGCGQYVAQNSSNARLARGVYWALRHLTSLVCMGTREHLAAAAAASSDADQCTAVVWALEVAFGFVLPTLLVWSTQLEMARQHAAQQEQQHGRHIPLPTQHRLLCEPLLDLADTFSRPVLIAGSGIAAFLAAVLWQHA